MTTPQAYARARARQANRDRVESSLAAIETQVRRTVIERQDDRRRQQRGEAAPFLVPTDQTLTNGAGEQPAPDAGEQPPQWLVRIPCMSRPIRPGDMCMQNRETGEIKPMRCQRNGCADCIGVNAWRRSLAVQYVQPSHELTLTTTDLHRSAAPWPQVQDRLRVLRQAANRDGVALGSFGTYLEQGTKAGMTHAHIVVRHGQRLDFDWFRRRLASAGFGSRFTYSELTSQAGFSSYIGKGFATYAVKGYRTDAEDALRLNAGRVGHFSRGFFPDGVRRAEVESLDVHRTNATEPSPWIARVWS